MTTQEEIHARLTQALSPTKLIVHDDSAAHAGHLAALEHPHMGHYRVEITSPAFHGKNTLTRHRMVYAALGELMHTRIHALVLDTKDVEE